MRFQICFPSPFMKEPVMNSNVELLTLPLTENTEQQGQAAVNQDINVLALVKGEERYVFLYTEVNRPEILRVIARYASNPDLSFNWYDAAVLGQKIRQESLQQAKEKQDSLVSLRYHLPLSAENDF